MNVEKIFLKFNNKDYHFYLSFNTENLSWSKSRIYNISFNNKNTNNKNNKLTLNQYTFAIRTLQIDNKQPRMCYNNYKRTPCGRTIIKFIAWI